MSKFTFIMMVVFSILIVFILVKTADIICKYDYGDGWRIHYGTYNTCKNKETGELRGFK